MKQKTTPYPIPIPNSDSPISVLRKYIEDWKKMYPIDHAAQGYFDELTEPMMRNEIAKVKDFNDRLSRLNTKAMELDQSIKAPLVITK